MWKRSRSCSTITRSTCIKFFSFFLTFSFGKKSEKKSEKNEIASFSSSETSWSPSKQTSRLTSKCCWMKSMKWRRPCSSCRSSTTSWRMSTLVPKPKKIRQTQTTGRWNNRARTKSSNKTSLWSEFQYRLIDRSIHPFNHRSIDWLIDSTIDWLIDGLIGLIDWLIWLIDWLIGVCRAISKHWVVPSRRRNRNCKDRRRRF